MNSLSSRQRKAGYVVGILILLVPIIFLGRPGGGMISQIRAENDLGETTLGDVDPASSAMNLVLLGMRGIAASVLHQNAIEYQQRKEWAKLRSSVNSIIQLQPHFIEIWKFQGWNLAFNVSREWDRVDDRYYWVKEGLKFIQTGTDRNRTSAFLLHNVGDFVSRKMGVSDEKRFFRRFFVRDPDTERYDGADPVINPDGIDSFLVARDWFERANVVDETHRVKGMTHVLFRQGPAKAMLNYAEIRQEEGNFDDANRAAWKEAYEAWTDEYGSYTFLGMNDLLYKLNSGEEDLEALAQENGVLVNEQRRVTIQNQNMTHFRFWRDFSWMEQQDKLFQAHRALYEAKKACSEGKIYDLVDATGQRQPSEGQVLIEEALAAWEAVFEDFGTRNPEPGEPDYAAVLRDSETYLENALLTVRYYLSVHEQNGIAVPDDYPLKELWESNPARQQDINILFRRIQRGAEQ